MVKMVGFNPGDRIGHYRVEAELGASGAGLLIQAQHLVLPRRVLIKVVHPAFAQVQEHVVQTLREACILEAIGHPGVPMIYESGVLRDRRPWFALEVIAGPTLGEVLAAGPLEALEVASVARDLAEILEHAHRRGVIHRGLRPDRVVITNARRYPVCIPDWSEAVAHDAVWHALPATPDHARAYVAPELGDDHAEPRAMIDDRADLFALGAIAYRALTGEPPIAPDAETCLRVGDARPDAPGELVAVIEACLAFDRFDRPSAGEVRAALDTFLDRVRRDAPPVQQHAAAQITTTRGKVDDDVSTKSHIVMMSSSRLRRPRWTPDVRYLETTHVDSKLATGEDDRIKD
jgi:serine/threonine protein kinase